MRNQTTVLLILLVLTGLLVFVPTPEQSVPTLEKTEPTPTATQENLTNVFHEELSLPVPFYQTAASNLPALDESPAPPSLQDRLFSSPLTNTLQSRTGSYTNLSDLFQNDGSFSTELQSSWLTPYLFPNRTLPELRLRVVKDPETDQYRISGGALSLPQSGLEAGYELEMDNENYKATIQWKKEF
ncbi:hypothetical protein [Tichowtungia aerotolerans]|uniref:Uncharacterized protein n=1 Tax=Tichowtungia aerotolerans TaxID=2697043 RepID=A0A6P1M8M4_9BACT|nr:hypothetical protein [Tichowtungia aerotolerans]QHI70247.1 hypothetical protein GT409_12610 [Tichowtungia aerotolerans]